MQSEWLRFLGRTATAVTFALVFLSIGTRPRGVTSFSEPYCSRSATKSECYLHSSSEAVVSISIPDSENPGRRTEVPSCSCPCQRSGGI